MAQFRTATSGEVAQLPQLVDPELLEGTTVNLSQSLIRPAFQYAETLLPMASKRQQPAELAYTWGLMLPLDVKIR